MSDIDVECLFNPRETVLIFIFILPTKWPRIREDSVEQEKLFLKIFSSLNHKFSTRGCSRQSVQAHSVSTAVQ